MKKCIFYPGYLCITDCNHIISNSCNFRMAHQIIIGAFTDCALLFLRHGFLWCSKRIVFAKLHFKKDYTVSFFSNNINLSKMTVEIAFQYTTDFNSEVFRSDVEVDEQGYIKVQHPTTATNIPGVFAAGDVADPLYRQAISAAGSGCHAAIDALHYLQEKGL